MDLDGFKRQAVLLALLDAMKANGSWSGETHVQKCAYFLEAGLGVPLRLEFLLYKHGPFSFVLRELLGEMRGRLLIDVETRYPFGPSLVVSESGNRLKGNFQRTIERWSGQVNFVALRLAQCDVAQLERLGTALYVKKEQGALPDTARAERIRELKPHIPLERALDAVQEVDRFLVEAADVTASTESA